MKRILKSFFDAETAFLSASFSFFMVIMLIAFCRIRMTSGIVVAAVLAAVFSVISIKNFTRIIISAEKITIEPFLVKKKNFSLDEIKEVGVIGTKVFPKSSSNNGGRKYIYFSPMELDEDGRFNLALKWPPKIPHTSFSDTKLEFVELIWGKPIIYYSASGSNHKQG